MGLFNSDNLPEYGISDILANLRADEGFRERFLGVFPDQADNVAKLVEDAKCRCRGKIMSMVAAYDGDDDHLGMLLWGEPVHFMRPRSLAGEYCDIPDDMLVYNKVIKRCEEFALAYRGISILPGANQGKRWLRLMFW